jgi:hypothetical protein
LDGSILMDGAPLAVQPEPGAVYSYSEKDAHFGVFVRFLTTRYAARLVTIRTSADAWTDRYGSYEKGAWAFELDAARHPPGTPFKFVLDGDTYMQGPNLILEADACAKTDFDEASVQFPQRHEVDRSGIAELAPGDTRVTPAVVTELAADELADIPGITLRLPSTTPTAGYPSAARSPTLGYLRNGPPR